MFHIRLKALPCALAIASASFMGFTSSPASAVTNFNSYASACGAVGYVPSMVPDINGGMAFHLTFTSAQLFTSLKQLCQQQQQVQMEVDNLTTNPLSFLNTPQQLSAMRIASAAVDPSLAGSAQSAVILQQSASNATQLDAAEQLLNLAQGRDQNIRAAGMINALNTDALQKILTLQAATQQADRQTTLNAAQQIQTNMSGSSPDLGDGFLI